MENNEFLFEENENEAVKGPEQALPEQDSDNTLAEEGLPEATEQASPEQEPSDESAEEAEEEIPLGDAALYIPDDEQVYYKKKRGLAGLLQKLHIKFRNWWNPLKKWQKRTIISVTSVLLALALLLSIFFIVFRYNYNDITENQEDLGFSEVINEKIINIALFGIDSRNVKSFKGLSDSIMILSLNTETKKIKIISVMRDSLVPIEQNGTKIHSKINSAYSRGGPELAIKTLNQCFSLDISEYATVNFYGMTDIIEAVGGIDATLTYSEVYAKNNLNVMIREQCKHMGIDPTPHLIYEYGEKHLNGIQAVAYARNRYGTNIQGHANDQGRTERQRYVMEQLFNKAIKLSKSQYITLAKALIPCSETSLSYSEIISLATNMLLESPTFEQSRIPLDEYQMASKNVARIGSCVYYDLDYASKVLHAFIYDDIAPEDYMQQYGIEKKDWFFGGGSYGGGTASSTISSSSQASSSSKVSSSSRPVSSASQGGGSSSSSSSQSSSSSVSSSVISSSSAVSSSNTSTSESQTSSEQTSTSSEATSSKPVSSSTSSAASSSEALPPPSSSTAPSSSAPSSSTAPSSSSMVGGTE